MGGRRGREGDERGRRGVRRGGMMDKEWVKEKETEVHHNGGECVVHILLTIKTAINDVPSLPSSLFPSPSQDRRVPGGATLSLHSLA